MALKILLVDDEPLVHLLFRNHLENSGFRVLSAANADEALATARAERPALIVMDVMLPGTNGLAALRELKANPQLMAIPVIVVTAAVDKYHETSQEAAASGAALFLTKPISPAQLIKEIERLLNPPPPANASGSLDVQPSA